MRIITHTRLRAGDADLAEKVDSARERFFLRNLLVGADSLDDLIADAVHGVERGHGLLEDHGHIVAAHLAIFLLGEMDEVFPVEGHLAAGNMTGLRKQAHDGQACDGFARTGLSHDSQNLAFADFKAHVVNCADHAAFHRKFGAEALHFKQHRATSSSTSDPNRREYRRRVG